MIKKYSEKNIKIHFINILQINQQFQSVYITINITVTNIFMKNAKNLSKMKFLRMFLRFYAIILQFLIIKDEFQ